MADLEKINQAIVKGMRKDIQGLVSAAVDEGIDPQIIDNDYMIEAMKEVGARFESKKIFVPEMMMAARTMQMGLEILRNKYEFKIREGFDFQLRFPKRIFETPTPLGLIDEEELKSIIMKYKELITRE